MTIRCRPRRARRLCALFFAVLIVWLVYVTAGHGFRAALSALSESAEPALFLLRSQLGGELPGSELPSMVAFAISQSPLLLSGQNSVLELRRSAEQDTVIPDTLPPQDSRPSSPITELPAEPEPPLVFLDNGVPARTLVPTSPDGYLVTGAVYIHNQSVRSISPDLFLAPPSVSLSPGSEPQVLIVHTHGSEAYTMPPGQSYVPCGDCRTTDESCSVVRIGAEIASVFTGAGISVIHDTTLHDYPQYSGAYDRSLATVEQYLENYPSIVLVLDIHRDAISDSAGNMYKIVSGVAGMNAAQMCFVVGTDGGGLSHPRWEENLTLAAAIQQELCSRYPTLMRPITVRNSRYNQHTRVGSLLVEMGAAGNSPDEAIFSARLLADAILRVLSASPPDQLPENENS